MIKRNGTSIIFAFFALMSIFGGEKGAALAFFFFCGLTLDLKRGCE
jgi:hypothetical protein